MLILWENLFDYIIKKKLRNFVFCNLFRSILADIIVRHKSILKSDFFDVRFVNCCWQLFFRFSWRSIFDFLSSIESIRFPDSIDKLKEHQDDNEELKHLLKPSKITVLKLKEFNHGFGRISIYFDPSTNQIRPYIPINFRRANFNLIYALAQWWQVISIGVR